MIFSHVDGFINHLRIEKSASKLTQAGYRADLTQYLNFLSSKYSLPLEEISFEYLNHKTVREYLVSMQNNGLSRATMARRLASLRSFVKYLCRENIIPGNPLSAVSTPRQDKKLPRFLYSMEINMLLEAPDTNTPMGRRDKAILEILYACGIRVSELVDLDVNDIFFDEELIKVHGKGSKERIVPLGSMAKAALQEYLSLARPYIKRDQSEQALFLNRFGQRLSTRSIRNILNKYVEMVAINQKTSPHTLRHTFATHMLNEGADLRSVQELLGHVSLSTTQIYTHLTRENIKTIYDEKHPRG